MKDYKAGIDKITSKEDFTRFVGHLLEDLQADPSTWKDNKLEKKWRYLVASKVM